MAAKRSALSATLKSKLSSSTTTSPVAQQKSLSAPTSAAKLSPTATALAQLEANTSKQKLPIRPAVTAKAAAAADAIDLEDFEQMPTFTIVNINDIINQKEDVVIEKTNAKSNNNNNATAATKRKVMPSRKIRDAVAADEFVDDDSDDDDFIPDDDEDDEEPIREVNRRKSMHTKILSEKIRQTPGAAAPRGAAVTQHTKLSPTTAASGAVRPYRNILGKKQTATEAATTSTPRVLNSTLCRNADNKGGTSSKTPTISKSPAGRFVAATPTSASMVKNNQQQLRLKENVKNEALSFASRQPQLKTPNTAESINRRVRKITSYETWFVIKMPTVETPPQKYGYNMTLMQLGNVAARIQLPSDKWSFKVTLHRKQKDAAVEEDEDDDVAVAAAGDDVYTGIVHDTRIPEHKKHLYQPINIMFRRSCAPEMRMQFDRAVIFKNKTFFINVDGRNIKLLGAPQTLVDCTDIETLLQIVDEITLYNSCVEQATYV